MESKNLTISFSSSGSNPSTSYLTTTTPALKKASAFFNREKVVSIFKRRAVYILVAL
jgi:hypothetical protein